MTASAVAQVEEERLKELFKTAIVEVLEERKDLVVDLLGEALEDIALGRAIQEAEGDERVGQAEILAILEQGD